MWLGRFCNIVLSGSTSVSCWVSTSLYFARSKVGSDFIRFHWGHSNQICDGASVLQWSFKGGKGPLEVKPKSHEFIDCFKIHTLSLQSDIHLLTPDRKCMRWTARRTSGTSRRQISRLRQCYSIISYDHTMFSTSLEQLVSRHCRSCSLYGGPSCCWYNENLMKESERGSPWKVTVWFGFVNVDPKAAEGPFRHPQSFKETPMPDTEQSKWLKMYQVLETQLKGKTFL